MQACESFIYSTYFYPRPPGGGRLAVRDALKAGEISIHALRVEGDPIKLLIAPTAPFNFYPRPPGGGRPPCWWQIVFSIIYFYPRPPGGGRPEEREAYEALVHISIHALRVEGDRTDRPQAPRKAEFLSTPSGWRATN